MYSINLYFTASLEFVQILEKILRYKISFESTFGINTESWYAVEPILRFWSDRNKFHVYS